jgi:hypothetical protein
MLAPGTRNAVRTRALSASPQSLAVSPFLRGEDDGKERGKHFAESAQAMCWGEEGAGEDVGAQEDYPVGIPVS